MAELATPGRGRPSRHPIVVRYHEAAEVVGALDAVAEGGRLTRAEAQRIVNRVGLQALGHQIAA